MIMVHDVYLQRASLSAVSLAHGSRPLAHGSGRGCPKGG